MEPLRYNNRFLTINPSELNWRQNNNWCHVMTGLGFVSTDLLISIILPLVCRPGPRVAGEGRPVRHQQKKNKPHKLRSKNEYSMGHLRCNDRF